MKVLSLFDGISCGMIALERAGFDVERNAVRPYPMIIHMEYPIHNDINVSETVGRSM